MEGELWLAAQPSELAKARDFAESGARAFCFDDHGRYQFKFAVSEAVANAIEHGRPSPDGRIHLRLVGEGDKLSLFVRDSGSFVASSPDPSRLPQRGRGLAFMVSLMDEVEVRTATGSTMIRLSKRRPPAASTARCRTDGGHRLAAAVG
jgi:anti-sigma regulatory factor (Ser/Thr protein kinase)